MLRATSGCRRRIRAPGVSQRAVVSRFSVVDLSLIEVVTVGRRCDIGIFLHTY